MGKRHRRRLRELGLRKQPQESKASHLERAKPFVKSLDLVGKMKRHEAH